jgi:hypothetical protein
VIVDQTPVITIGTIAIDQIIDRLSTAAHVMEIPITNTAVSPIIATMATEVLATDSVVQDCNSVT